MGAELSSVHLLSKLLATCYTESSGTSTNNKERPLTLLVRLSLMEIPLRSNSEFDSY